MTLEHIYYLGQTIAVVAVVATLIAILLQGRQTNRLARADLSAEVWQLSGQMNSSWYQTEEGARFMHRALYGVGEPLDQAERLRFRIAVGSAVGPHEIAFNLYRRGLMAPETMAQLDDGAMQWFVSPAVRADWARRRQSSRNAAHVKHVDRLVAELEEIMAARQAAKEKEGAR